MTSDRRKPPTGVEALFATAVGLSAFLLFTVQFLTGKKLLPWFGGVPSVWAVCLVFFQVLLFAGYLFAHLVATRLPAPRQRVAHLALVGAALASLAVQAVAWPAPLLPAASYKPVAGDAPVGALLRLLATSVGAPFLALASTGPLLSSWFARLRPDRSPWRLYALSNAGSLAGLLAYPFLLEPGLALPAQGRLVAAGFALFAILAGAAAILAGRGASEPASRPLANAARPGRARTLLWVALAAVPSLLLVAVTNQITLEIAVVPLLWVLPLALYLLSFILCFERPGFAHRGVFVPLAMGASALAAWALGQGPDLPLAAQAGILGLLLFAYATALHGELVRLRPAPAFLTRFYLAVSAGGAAGGLLASLVAPVVFPALWELPVAVVAGALLLAVRVLADEPAWLYRSPWRHRPALLLFLAWILGLGWTFSEQARDQVSTAMRTSRNFYGWFRVTREAYPAGVARSLKHGRISHGIQFETEPWSERPTTYYGELTGVGLALRLHPRRGDGAGPLRVGVVGLGTGSVAVYARPGDSWRFYEINPEITALSKGVDPLFTYLARAPSPVEVSPGDARLSLEREAPRRFDVLVLDAFSSDAIPLHLVTREAFDLWFSHLADGGILAVHISNRFLDLGPVVRRLAVERRAGFAMVLSQREGLEIWPTRWVLMAEKPETLERPGFAAFASDPPAPGPLFTDDYSNLLRILRW